MMNRNKNTKSMLAELREEYPVDYEIENIRVDVVDKLAFMAMVLGLEEE